MKKKKPQSRTQKIGEWNREWWRYGTSRTRATVWIMTVAGVGLSFISLYGLFAGNIVSSFGSLLFGLGVTAAGGSFLVGIYWKLTKRSMFRIWIVNRVGLMVLGPAGMLILRPWKDVATLRDAILACTLLCAISVVPCGVSIGHLIWKYRKEK